MVKFDSYNEYDFDQNIINDFKEKARVFGVGINEKESTVQKLKSQLGNDANRLDSDLEWMKNSQLVGVRDNKETELVFFSNKDNIFFQIEPDWKRFFGMYVTVRPYIDNDGNPDEPYVMDEVMYIGRVQMNLNDGRKRKFLYFQTDYELKQ